MKRRQFLQSAAAVSALVLPAARTVSPQAPPAGPIPVNPPAAPLAEAPKLLEFTIHDAAGQTAARFFSPRQFATLRRLSDILMPPFNGAPGALDAGAPEFLDFLIAASSEDRRRIYRIGLDRLNARAEKLFKQTFEEVDSAQAAVLLAPLRQAWTLEAPADPVEHFLHEAKQDVRTATINSREWNAVTAARGSRYGRAGLYWYTLDKS